MLVHLHWHFPSSSEPFPSAFLPLHLAQIVIFRRISGEFFERLFYEQTVEFYNKISILTDFNLKEQNEAKRHYLNVSSNSYSLFEENIHTYWFNSHYDLNRNVSYEKKKRRGSIVSTSFYNEEENLTFGPLKYVQYLTVNNSLNQMTGMNFEGFEKLRTVDITNMPYIENIDFINLLPADAVSTFEEITLANIPKVDKVSFNVTSDDYKIAFVNGATIDLGALKYISNML